VAPRIPDELSTYAERATTPAPEHLRRVQAETQAELDCPQMLSGIVEGRLLQALLWAAGAKRVLEIGTYSGYSALAMAEALPPDGTVVTCELSPERADFARRHVDASPYGDRIEIRVGPALDTLAELRGPFDLVFIDADKAGYPAYYEAALPLLAPRGLIVLDNTLMGGAALPEHDDGREATRAVRELNQRLAADESVVSVLLSVRDGVTVVRRREV